MKVLPFTAMWLDLENIRLREINQRKRNTVPRLVKERGRRWAEAFFTVVSKGKHG